MNAHKLAGCAGLAAIALALILSVSGCKPSMLRLRNSSCLIKTAGELQLNASIIFGGLIIKSITPAPDNPERIVVHGKSGDIRQKNGIYELSSHDDMAEVYIDEKRAISVTGIIGKDLEIWNHRGPLAISANIDHIGILNHHGPLTIQRGSSKAVDIQNHKGDLRLNQVHGRVSITNLEGSLDAMVYGNLTLLNQESGDATITAHGSVVVQNFAVDLQNKNRFELLMKNRPTVERILKERGRTLAIRSSGFEFVKLMNINARRLDVEGSGVNILGVFALETQLRMADGIMLQNIQSPLKMVLCRNGNLNGLEMDYALEQCSKMQLDPRDELGPRGRLKKCWDIVFWNTQPGQVGQDGCERVIFAGEAKRSPAPAPAASDSSRTADRPSQPQN